MIYVCADDYGLTDLACDRIDNCLENGALNKISVVPNGKATNLKNRILNGNALLSLHINLVEGKALSQIEKVSLITDKNSFFKYSFTGLLFMSFLPKWKKLENQLYCEIREQLKFFKELSAGKPFGVDSHQHTHMIPLVFKTLMRAIRDEGIKLDYIRIPAEPILPYLVAPSLYLTYSPMNIIKQWLLKFLAFVNRKELEKSGMNSAYFMGVLFSGKMDEKRVLKVLKHYLKLSDKNRKDIEILFHPGYIEKDEAIFDENKKSFNKFYYSEGRKTEFNALMNKKIKSNMKEECENAVH